MQLFVNDPVESRKRPSLMSNLRRPYLESKYRNNVLQIFHRTVKTTPTEVLDYNQIVPPEQRRFKMNNGLRFIVVHCHSVEDARRRALAMAMKTFDRKRGNFVKLFCPSQMTLSTFLTNITHLWNGPVLKD